MKIEVIRTYKVYYLSTWTDTWIFKGEFQDIQSALEVQQNIKAENPYIKTCIDICDTPIDEKLQQIFRPYQEK